MPTADIPARYRLVPGYLAYRVFDAGEVQTRNKSGPGTSLGCDWRTMRPWLLKNGYLQLRLHNDQGQKAWCVHQLVLMAFVGPCPPGMECRHLNGNAQDNRLENLAWGTHQSNMADRRLHGRHAGVTHHAAKLNPEKVREIRERYANGETVRQLAAAFGVCFSTISLICLRKRWSSVE